MGEKIKAKSLRGELDVRLVAVMLLLPVSKSNTDVPAMVAGDDQNVWMFWGREGREGAYGASVVFLRKYYGGKQFIVHH